MRILTCHYMLQIHGDFSRCCCLEHWPTNSITEYLTHSHYPDVEYTSLCLILAMRRTVLGNGPVSDVHFLSFKKMWIFKMLISLYHSLYIVYLKCGRTIR